MADTDRNALLALLRTQLTAVNQQFSHMLALGQWGEDALVARIKEVDDQDFKNSMRMMDRLVLDGVPLELAEDRVSLGSDVGAVLTIELEMEQRFAKELAAIAPLSGPARALVDGVAAPRDEYRGWLEAQELNGSKGADKAADHAQLVHLMSELLALVEQGMAHAFLRWHAGDRSGADWAWQMSGAAMLHATAIVRRCALTHSLPETNSAPALQTAPDREASVEMDRALMERCTTAALAVADRGDDPLARLCQRIADDGRSICAAGPGDEFPAELGKSKAFASFAASRDYALN